MERSGLGGEGKKKWKGGNGLGWGGDFWAGWSHSKIMRRRKRRLLLCFQDAALLCLRFAALKGDGCYVYTTCLFKGSQSGENVEGSQVIKTLKKTH